MQDEAPVSLLALAGASPSSFWCTLPTPAPRLPRRPDRTDTICPAAPETVVLRELPGAAGRKEETGEGDRPASELRPPGDESLRCREWWERVKWGFYPVGVLRIVDVERAQGLGRQHGRVVRGVL